MEYSIMTGVCEIYFNDLTEEAKKVFLKAMNMKDPAEGNYDVYPIAIVECLLAMCYQAHKK